jgi:tetratricopeptide (TPR) repeat protein
VEILGSLHARNDSPLYAENLAQNLIHWGDVLMQTGEIDQAGELFGRAGELLDALVEHDPDNGIWRGDRAINAYHQGEHARVSGDPVQARAQLREASSEFRLLLETEPTDVRSAEFLSLTERSEGLLESAIDPIASARSRMLAILEHSGSLKPRTTYSAALVSESLGAMLADAGDSATAVSTWRAALDLLDRVGGSSPSHLALKYRLLTNLGEHAKAEPLRMRLRDIGYKDPRFDSASPRKP